MSTTIGGLGRGEMAGRVLAYDWAATPLGAIEGWPASLRIAVGICLGSRFPMFVWWGPERVHVYNDAYAPILGKRHPKALGRPADEVWRELWPIVGPQAELVLREGAATWNERVHLVLERNGYSEDGWFTWSYSPIPDDAGGTGGLLCVCADETAHVVGERERERLLADVESERTRLASIFAQSPAFLAVLRGPDHVFDFVNTQYQALVGSRGLLGRPVRDALPEVEGQGFFETLDRVYRTGEPYRGTNIRLLLDRSGRGPEETFLDFVYQAMRGGDGEIQGILAHGIDVTDQRRSELRDRFLLQLDEALRPLTDPAEITARGAELLGEHLSADRCAYADVEADEDTFNLTGDHNRNVPSIVGRYRFSDFGTEVLALLREDRPYVVHDVDHHLPALGDLTWYRKTLIQAVICVPLHKDGRFVAAMAVHQRTARVWGPEEVAIVRHVASRCWESLERARVEKALRASESTLRAEKDVLERIASGAPLGEVLDAIARALEAQSPDRPRCSVQVLDPDEELPTGGEEVGAAFFTPVLSGDGRVLGAVGLHYPEPRPPSERDLELTRTATHLAGIVLERHLVDQRLRESLEAETHARSDAERASRMKDDFLATLSHELRTPLNAILGWSQLLARRPLDDEVHRGIEVIERNARAQAKIIEDLLDVSSILSGKVRLEHLRVDLTEVVSAAVEAARPAATAKGIALLRPEATPSALAWGDPHRLQQVLWNLLSNAVKFTPRGGRVQVSLTRDADTVQIRVTDTGVGIGADFLPFVFDRFRQADATTTRRHGGLGLGLAIVKHLVELHGGAVRAESLGPGSGATFVVTLLTVQRFDSSPPAEVGAPVDPATELTGVRVLVVDDERDAREIVQRILEEAKAIVVTAASAAEAFACLRGERFDVLVTDIGMPGEDGYTLLRRLRSLPASAHGDLPAVALTAYARPEDRVKALRAGFQLHLAKPLEPTELVTMVASLANRL